MSRSTQKLARPRPKFIEIRQVDCKWWQFKESLCAIRRRVPTWKRPRGAIRRQDRIFQNYYRKTNEYARVYFHHPEVNIDAGDGAQDEREGTAQFICYVTNGHDVKLRWASRLAGSFTRTSLPIFPKPEFSCGIIWVIIVRGESLCWDGWISISAAINNASKPDVSSMKKLSLVWGVGKAYSVPQIAVVFELGKE